jgi:hypothetical protein
MEQMDIPGAYAAKKNNYFSMRNFTWLRLQQGRRRARGEFLDRSVTELAR